MEATPSSVTQLLHDVRAGDKAAMDRLFPLVYSELRRLADSCLRRERAGHTLQRTALVHEAYVRLVAGSQPDYQDRAHFLGIAARIMRQILVDYARRRNAGKRSAAMQVPLIEASAASIDRPASMIELDDALSDLEKHDERKARLIEMRFFGGLTAEESAEVLELTVPVVRRELRLAQAWLERELDRRAAASPPEE
ncbi:MAG TPA: sigma-70 family RNA polymerase sigma factor [Bryobacteraceae bacterium]|jgi:RNA polymerase sigma factor (TIGR02999 family)